MFHSRQQRVPFFAKAVAAALAASVMVVVTVLVEAVVGMQTYL